MQAQRGPWQARSLPSSPPALREALADGEIYMREIGLAGDTPFILGTTGSGGTMCGSVPYVVSFASEPPAVDVSPLE